MLYFYCNISSGFSWFFNIRDARLQRVFAIKCKTVIFLESEWWWHKWTCMEIPHSYVSTCVYCLDFKSSSLHVLINLIDAGSASPCFKQELFTRYIPQSGLKNVAHFVKVFSLLNLVLGFSWGGLEGENLLYCVKDAETTTSIPIQLKNWFCFSIQITRLLFLFEKHIR